MAHSSTDSQHRSRFIQTLLNLSYPSFSELQSQCLGTGAVAAQVAPDSAGYRTIFMVDFSYMGNWPWRAVVPNDWKIVILFSWSRSLGLWDGQRECFWSCALRSPTSASPGGRVTPSCIVLVALDDKPRILFLTLTSARYAL